MQRLVGVFAFAVIVVSCFAQFQYPKVPKSTNDATIIEVIPTKMGVKRVK